MRRDRGREHLQRHPARRLGAGRAAAALLAAAAALLALAAPAATPARSKAGSPVRWTRAEVVLRPVAPPAASGIGAAELEAALRQAADGWNQALEACPVPRLRVGAPEPAGTRARADGRNVVLLLTDAWCPERASDPAHCYDRRWSGVTNLHPRQVPGSAHDGELLEVDVQLNAVHFRWSPTGGAEGSHSLLAVLAHELGHVLGLDHDPPGAEGTRASIMYPDPVEPGRAPVLRPDEAEVALLCRAYRRGAAPRRGRPPLG